MRGLQVAVKHNSDGTVYGSNATFTPGDAVRLGRILQGDVRMASLGQPPVRVHVGPRMITLFSNLRFQGPNATRLEPAAVCKARLVMVGSAIQHRLLDSDPLIWSKPFPAVSSRHSGHGYVSEGWGRTLKLDRESTERAVRVEWVHKDVRLTVERRS
jgi:hypothetical protein